MFNHKSKLLLATLAVNNIAVAALNDTGITTCSNETQNGLPCPVAGFPGQDGDFVAPFDFTKLDANGNAMAVTATNHSCVQDNTTGLMWEVKTDDGGLRDKDNYYTFDEAATFATQVNATNLCGHNDWRVPELHELASIVDYSVFNPSIDDEYFPNTVSGYYWTNSPYAAYSSHSWIVYFSVGVVFNDSRGNSNAVRLVRGGQLTFSSFTSLGDGTVTAPSTGLMWAKCSLGQGATDCSGSATNMTWANALTAADSSTLAGYIDWRLPNVKELQSLANYAVYNPAINSTYFPNTLSGYYWSSSPYAAYSSDSWRVHFHYGSVFSSARSNSYAVRLVRGGQWLFSFSLSVAKAGNGAGSITSNPSGINCGSDCSESFAKDTVVKLTATPAAGSTFAGFSGDADCSDGSVTMNAAKTCTATFNLIPKPDFTIPVMTIAPAAPVTNGTFTATVTVKNQSTVAADGGQLRLFSNQPTAPACAATGGDKNVAVGTLAAGASKTFTVPGLNAGAGGLKTLRAFVDATCAKVESNETNNQRTLNYRVAGRKADLVVTAMTVTPAAPAINGTFVLAVTVKNQGSTISGTSFLDVWTNQATAQACGAVGNLWSDVGSLAVGATKTLSFTLPAGAAGTKTARAFVDSWCETVESNEANNQMTKSYTVQ